MLRTSVYAVAILLALSAPATAQFRWQRGQTMSYKVEHSTAASDTTKMGQAETRTKMNVLKRWQVLEVDAQGIGTLQMTLLALRLETTPPNGTQLVFDSQAPDKSDKQLAEQLGKYVGQVLFVLRVDPQGRVVEVKECKHGPASRFESEPPFQMVFPLQVPSEGSAWERPYKVTLEPPQGTGEKYDASQRYECKKVAPGGILVNFGTTLKTQPDNVADRLPLLQMQPEGEVVFDTQNGRMHRAVVRINKELAGHQGEGSSYKFQSMYVEEYAGN